MNYSSSKHLKKDKFKKKGDLFEIKSPGSVIDKKPSAHPLNIEKKTEISSHIKSVRCRDTRTDTRTDTHTDTRADRHVININETNKYKIDLVVKKDPHMYYNIKKELMLNMDQIIDRITKSNQNNKYDIYTINLKSRTDKRQYIIDSMNEQTIFNVNFFDAIKHEKGYIGCGLSHLSLIKYAKTLDLPYIIVMEDDNKFINYEETSDIINWLTENLDDWDIFNGNPTMIEINNKSDRLLKYRSKNDKLCYVSWGQTTNFIIYNKSSYDKMLSYKLDNHIDLFIPKMFLQLCPLNFITIQQPFYSDISHNKMSESMTQNIYTNAQMTIKNSNMIETIPTIGIFSIFIDTYILFYKKFIKNMESNFLPHFKKYYYIVTDKHDIDIYNDRTFIFFTEKI